MIADMSAVEDARERMSAARQRIINAYGWAGEDMADELIAATREYDLAVREANAAREATMSGS